MLKYNSKGIQPIVPGIINTQGVNVPLVTFESLVDTDFGLMLYIDRNFLDPTTFDIDFFNSHHKIRQMIWALMNRDEWNPLYLCMNKKLEAPKALADEIYEEFMYNDKHYTKILDLSMLTNLCDFVKITEMNGKDVMITIICQTEYEQEFVDKRITQTTRVISYQELLEKEKRDEYQQFFFKHLDDPLILPIILDNRGISEFVGTSKTIYLADYKFNNVSSSDIMEKESPLQELASSPNQIKIYSPYDKELYKEREETNNGISQ